MHHIGKEDELCWLCLSWRLDRQYSAWRSHAERMSEFWDPVFTAHVQHCTLLVGGKAVNYLICLLMKSRFYANYGPICDHTILASIMNGLYFFNMCWILCKGPLEYNPLNGIWWYKTKWHYIIFWPTYIQFKFQLCFVNVFDKETSI